MLEVLYDAIGDQYLAKIAVKLGQALSRCDFHGVRGTTAAHLLASGDGWAVKDVVCTCGPHDRSFEEQHTSVSIAIVAAGSFQYRASSIHCGAGHELMTPGSLLLGNAEQNFECRHEHAVGDRCIAFHYGPEYFERLAADAGACGSKLDFNLLRLPPLRELSPLIVRACTGLVGPANLSGNVPWEELSIQLAARAVQLVRGKKSRPTDAPPSAVARVTRTVRMIERDPDAGLTLGDLALESGLSPYHFLRTFERLTGVTPHQYVLRSRLREAAMRLALKPARVLDIVFECGFGDVSNFNRAFRSEFGTSPRAFRSKVS